MKVFRLAAVFALLAGPAYAQLPNINLMPETKTLTPEEKEQEAAQQRAYRDSLKKIPDAKAANDPWGTVRSTDTPKTSCGQDHGAGKAEDQDRECPNQGGCPLIAATVASVPEPVRPARPIDPPAFRNIRRTSASARRGPGS